MKKYNSINQFRNVVKLVRNNADYKQEPYPTLSFTGQVKLHGTNAAIVKYKDGLVKYQSRERELSQFSDNAGFHFHMSNVNTQELFEGIKFNDYIAIYGEWCGSGVQKGVGLSELNFKMFVIFDVIVDGEYLTDYTKDLQDIRIYNINNFPKYKVDIDFNKPELSQNELIDLTLKIEEECPVAKYFGISGVGEGLVFKCDSDRSLMFKSKGEKHSVSQVKVLNPVDTEKLGSISEFIEYACTDNRMAQGLENVESQEPKYTGDFIRWVTNDIIKEESDTLLNNNLEFKDVAAGIAKKCKLFFLNKV